MNKRAPTEPETRVGNCCGCNQYPLPLFKVPGIYRYRCDSCFERETGYRHHMAPSRRIALP
jgi:hypothetical protein